MTINERVKAVRKALGLSQAALATRLDIGQAAVSMLEQEGNTVSDRNIRQLSREFGVNETWLREETGEMFADDTAQLIDPLQRRFNLTADERKHLTRFLTATPGERRKILEALRTIARLIQ